MQVPPSACLAVGTGRRIWGVPGGVDSSQDVGKKDMAGVLQGVVEASHMAGHLNQVGRITITFSHRVRACTRTDRSFWLLPNRLAARVPHKVSAHGGVHRAPLRRAQFRRPQGPVVDRQLKARRGQRQKMRCVSRR